MDYNYEPYYRNPHTGLSTVSNNYQSISSNEKLNNEYSYSILSKFDSFIF